MIPEIPVGSLSLVSDITGSHGNESMLCLSELVAWLSIRITGQVIFKGRFLG